MAETRAPALERWDWQQLERVTEALLAREPGVLTASQFGTLGQTQFGIDTKGELKGGGCIVASCKKQDEIEDGALDTWSTAFLKHWDARWKSKKVRRFILVTTADVSRTQVVDAADTERERFSGFEVDYELWGQPQLIEKMRPHRGIVAQFVGIEWVDILCGPQQREALQSTGAAIGIEGVGARQVAELRALLSGEAEQRVARGLEDLRAGDTGAVGAALADLRAEPFWSEIDPGAQARVLRFAASAALQRDDLETAIAFADQADAIRPAEEPRLAARIAYHRDGARAGLAVLGTPVTRDGRQLQAALMLGMGDVDGAEGVLALLDADGPDPETLRLHAWLQLMRDRRADALATVAQLEQEAGHWIATMRTAAIVRYAATLSPLLAPEWFLNASPVDLDLVRDDDEGRDLLTRAIDGLRALAVRTGDLDDRRWLLAALSNQRERRDEAQTLARELIAAFPGDPIVVGWSIARRFDVDLSPSRAILAVKYAEGRAEQIDVRVYALLLASREEHAIARAALADGLDGLLGEARIEAETWIARLAAELGEREVPGEVPATDRLVDEIAAARDSSDWSRVGPAFAALVSGDRPEPQALAVAQLLAAEARWEILSPYRDAILSFATAEAVRIVAYIVAATDSADALTEFVAEHRAAFRNSEPPPDVRRLIVERQHRSGDLVGALAEARALSAQSGVSADRQLEAQIRASIGDTTGAAGIVRDLMGSAQLDPGAALRWGEALRGNNPDLARALWQYAVGRDAERRHAVPAYFQAFSLGLEGEAAPLLRYVAQAAEQGSPYVRTMHADDLPAMLGELNAGVAENRDLYLDGRVPAHLLAEQERTGIDQFVLAADSGETGPLRLRLLRNGARPRRLSVGLPWSQWRLHMDISAILLAAEQDLLDLIERHPHPVRISPAAPPALIDMQREAAPGQPARLDLLRDLAVRLDHGLAVRTRGTGDLVVALRGGDDDRPLDLDPRELIEAAFAAGVIDEAAMLRARALFAAEPNDVDGVSADLALVPGSPLWLAGAAAEQLERSGSLPDLIAAFDLAIDPDAASAIRAYVASEGAKADRAAWLDALRERLLRGIEAGRFEFVRRPEDGEADAAREGTHNASTISLMDMLTANGVPNGVTWFEDRQLTGYPANNGHPIVEFVDVLEALAGDGVLDEADRRARFSRFLASGGGFVQLEAADVVPAQRMAPVVDGVLRETPALGAIRRNRAATRLLDMRYKVGPPENDEDHRPDESQLFTKDMRLAETCFTEIWSDPSQTIEQCVARSEWIWRALRVERALRPIPEDTPGAAARHLATLSFAAALESLAMPVTVPLGIRRERRRAFSTWFWNAALGPHLIGDPDMLERIATYYEQLYLPRLTGRDPTATNLRLEFELARIRVAALPRPVLNAVGATERFGKMLGLGTIEVVTIRGVRFEADRFWRAVRTARRYGSGRIRTLDGKRCRVTRTDNGIALSGGVHARLADAICGLFDPGVEPLVAFAALLGDLELPPAEVERFLDDARRARSPRALSSALIAARKRSAKAVYETLDEAFQPNLRIAGEVFLPPPALSLLHYLRLVPGEADFGERLDAAARTLRDELGPTEALRRLSGLPIAGLLGRVGTEASDEVVATLAHGAAPVALFHWAEAALAGAGGAVDRKTITREVIAKMRRGAPALIAVLGWSVRAFWRDSDYRALGPADRLALLWAHAGRVLDTFLSRRADPELVTRYFSEIEFNEPMSEALDFARFVDRDAASPTSLTPSTFVFHALGALIRDAPLADYLDEEEEVAIRASAVLGDGSTPAPAFTLRNFDGQNLLGSFLNAAPAAWRQLAGEPEQLRARLISDAIATIASDRDDALSWAMLTQHARTGLTDDQLASGRALLLALDVEGLGMGARDELPIPRLVVKAMGQILEREQHGKILDTIRAVARTAADDAEPAALRWQDNERGTLEPIHEMLEICAVYAGIEAEGMFERLEAAAIAAIEQWPAAVPAFRELIDQVVRSNGVSDAVALWRLHLHLNACP